MEEIWKDIPNYEGLYQISNRGRVRSVDKIANCKNGRTFRVKGKLLTLTNHKRGYKTSRY